jgi:hypothetical protein
MVGIHDNTVFRSLMGHVDRCGTGEYNESQSTVWEFTDAEPI